MPNDKDKKPSLTNLPREGSQEVGSFFYELYRQAYQERLRLKLEDRWVENHRLFRGVKLNQNVTNSSKYRIPINLFFANVIRAVSNITAREPVAEVVGMDGQRDDSEITLSTKLKTWWSDTEQNTFLSKSVQNMEIYGITIEKNVYNISKKCHDVVILDPFAFLPAPGYYEELNDAPYLCHFYADTPENIEAFYGVEGVEADNVYSVLGEGREDNRPIPSGSKVIGANLPGNYSVNGGSSSIDGRYREKRALIIEVWVRDYSTRDVETQEPMLGEDGQPVLDEIGNPSYTTNITKEYVYPGNIRVVTLTNNGKLVLDDKPNPNINFALPPEVHSQTYLYNRYPFSKANSYEDATSLWGFSAIEQVGDIMNMVSETLSRVAFYLARVATPILIIPKDTLITKEMITNKPGLVIQPQSSMSAAAIRFLQVPRLPSNYFDILSLYVKFFDRVSQVEDADRGAVPARVVSGVAINYLQERNSIINQAKTRSVDALVRERGRCALSFFQNFGVDTETVFVKDEPKNIRGIDYAGRKYNYVVEAGSTVAKTDMQVQEQAMMLYDKGAIDRSSLLENLNFPGWRDIVERTGEGMVNQAMSVLVQAGLPEETAKALTQFLMQNQGGPGYHQANKPQQSSATQIKHATGG